MTVLVSLFRVAAITDLHQLDCFVLLVHFICIRAGGWRYITCMADRIYYHITYLTQLPLSANEDYINLNIVRIGFIASSNINRPH